MSRLQHYASIGALALASAAFIHAARTTYSNVQVHKDEGKLSAPLNETHHIEVYPDLSKIRITANQPDQTSYSYNMNTMSIEGYELSQNQLPAFLKDKQSLSDIQRKACFVLSRYSPIDTFYLTKQAQIAISGRRESVTHMAHKFCP